MHISRDLSRPPTGRAPTDVPATRFLRPYDPRLRGLDGLRLRRIRRELAEAAARGAAYHLWWHPHNFGVHLAENLAFLDGVLDAAAELGLESRNMGELAAA